MTAIQAVEYILKDNWEDKASNVSGRENNVPKPNIIREKNTNKRHVNLRDYDVIFVKDGGRPDIIPKSLGWVEEEIRTKVTIDMYTSTGRERLFGERDRSTNTGESYGGLSGEVKRILDMNRGGYEEWDLIITRSLDDLQSETSSDIWRAEYQIELVQFANQIQQSC